MVVGGQQEGAQIFPRSVSKKDINNKSKSAYWVSSKLILEGKRKDVK